LAPRGKLTQALDALTVQLLAVPGAPDSLIPDYFREARVDAPGGHEVEAWRLADGGRIALETDPAVLRLDGRLALAVPDEIALAARLHAASLGAISPIALALCALAMGLIDGDREVKRALPALYKGAQELFLIAACRLCG
jgi:hypothetical protein